LQDREHFRKEYLQPALQAGVIEMTRPDNPRAANQKYFLTAKGQKILAEM
jgi:ATP-dependent DNA helicase RecG